MALSANFAASAPPAIDQVSASPSWSVAASVATPVVCSIVCAVAAEVMTGASLALATVTATAFDAVFVPSLMDTVRS